MVSVRGWKELQKVFFFHFKYFQETDSTVIVHETVSDKLRSVWKTSGECPPAPYKVQEQPDDR